MPTVSSILKIRSASLSLILREVLELVGSYSALVYLVLLYIYWHTARIVNPCARVVCQATSQYPL